MAVYEISHPLIRHKLGLLREKDISTKDFRELAAEVAMLLAYEATRNLPAEQVTIETWSGPVAVDRIKGKKITIVPILRAGLEMMNGVLGALPNAKVSVVGLYRDEKTLQPVTYFEKIGPGYRPVSGHDSRSDAGHGRNPGRDHRHAEKGGVPGDHRYFSRGGA